MKSPRNNQQLSASKQSSAPVFNFKNAVLPITNPIGNPFPNPLKLPQNKDLKGLQVKLVLNKLSDPPRCYAEKIKMDTETDMDVDNGIGNIPGGTLRLGDRFEKIQDAKRAIPFMALKQSVKQQNGSAKPTV